MLVDFQPGPPLRSTSPTATGGGWGFEWPAAGGASAAPCSSQRAQGDGGFENMWDVPAKERFQFPDSTGKPLWLNEAKTDVLSLPELRIKTSNINHQDAGFGVFTRTPVRRGDFLTVYGGRVVYPRDHSKDQRSHLYALELGHPPMCLDGRVHEADQHQFSRQYYIENHMLGSFVNEANGTGLKANGTLRIVCSELYVALSLSFTLTFGRDAHPDVVYVWSVKYVRSEIHVVRVVGRQTRKMNVGAWCHPYDQGQQHPVSRIVLIQASEDIPPDTELLVPTYGSKAGFPRTYSSKT